MPGELYDIRMMAKAVQQRWPIQHEYRAAVIKRLVRVVLDPASSPREVTAAARGLISAEAQNQQDEHKLVDVSLHARNARLSAIAAELGIDESLVRIAAEEASGDAGGDGDGTAEE